MHVFLKELPSLNGDQTFLDLHAPASSKPLKSRPEAELITPRIRSHKGLQLFTEATWWRDVISNSLISFEVMHCVYMHANKLILTRLWLYSPL